MKRIVAMVAVVTLCLALAGVAGANLVTNGGFETGTFSGWTLDPAPPNDYTSVDAGTTEYPAHSGTYYADFGPDPAQIMYQNIATTPSGNYTLSFWLTNFKVGTPNSYEVQWGGTTVASGTNVAAFDYTQFSYPVSATGSSTELRFIFYNPPEDFGLDDVVVTPIPGAICLLGSGLLGLAGWRRVRKS